MISRKTCQCLSPANTLTGKNKHVTPAGLPSARAPGMCSAGTSQDSLRISTRRLLRLPATHLAALRKSWRVQRVLGAGLQAHICRDCCSDCSILVWFKGGFCPSEDKPVFYNPSSFLNDWMVWLSTTQAMKCIIVTPTKAHPEGGRSSYVSMFAVCLGYAPNLRSQVKIRALLLCNLSQRSLSVSFGDAFYFRLLKIVYWYFLWSYTAVAGWFWSVWRHF